MIVMPSPGNSPGESGTFPAATLGVAVGDYLHDAIVTGAFPPGSALKEKDLADSLNISSTPIRDALGRLAQTGLVEIISNKSKRISPLDRDVVVDLLSIRLIVADRAYQLGLPRISATASGQLEFQIEALKMGLMRKDHSAALDAVFRADQLLVESFGSIEAKRIIESRNSYLKRHILLKVEGWISETILQHYVGALDAISRKDFPLARTNAKAVWLRLLDNLEQSEV